MKYLNMSYTCRVLDRLANAAYRRGGIEYMHQSIDRALDKIWIEVRNNHEQLCH